MHKEHDQSGPVADSPTNLGWIQIVIPS